MANNDSNIQNGLGDHIASSGPQQADSVIDLTSSGSPGHPLDLTSSPRATPAPLSSPGRAVEVEQGDHPDERSEQPRAPVAEMLPSNPRDSPLFCSQESEATPEPMTEELSGHHAAVSEADPAYSYVTNTGLSASIVGRVGQETTIAIEKRYYCPLCNKSYSRAYRVRDHFEICQYENGNPDDLQWNSDRSCWPLRLPANPDDQVCPLCQCKFSRASEAAAHFVTCAEKNGNPQNIVFQGINTGIDTLYGEEEAEVGQYRCALCNKVSGKRSHARTHWKGCPVKQNTSAREWRRYDKMGRLKDRAERADDGKKVAESPPHQVSNRYRCELCKRKNNKRDLAVDHFKRCLVKHNTTRDKMSHLDDTGMPICPASEASVRASGPGRKRSRRVAFDADSSEDEEAANDPAPGARRSTTEQQVAESGGAGAASDITGTQGPPRILTPMWYIRQQLLPNGAPHLFRTRFISLEGANREAAKQFISEVTRGWTPEDRAGQRKKDFARGVLDMLPALEEGEMFWAKEKDCVIDGEEGDFVVWVKKVELGDESDS